MAGAFPTSIPAYTNPGPTDTTGAEVGTRTHDEFHADNNDDIEALSTKLGTGSSTPTANTVLRGTGAGTTAYGQIVNADIAPTADINGAKLLAASVTADRLYAHGVTNRVLATTDAVNVAMQQVTGAMIANDTITATQLAADSVGASELADNAVVNANVAASAAVVVSKLACGGTANRVVGTSDGTTVAMIEITGPMIQSSQIGSSHLAANSVSQTAMQDNSVGTAELLDANVTTAKLATDAVTVRRSVSNGTAASTTSASAVDLTGMTTGSFSTSGGDLLVFVTLTTYNGTVNAAATITVDLDGASTQLSLGTTGVANQNLNQGGVVLLTGVSAAAHTVKLRWATTAGTVNRNGASVLSVVEMKR